MHFTSRFRLLFRVFPFVAILVVVKIVIHKMGFEAIALDALVPSAVGGAIFIMGFLLSHVLADYKEAERMPGDMRIALEAIHDEATNLARRNPAFDLEPLEDRLRAVVESLEAGLAGDAKEKDLKITISHVDALAPTIAEMEDMDMPERFVARVKGAQDDLRKVLFRMAYVQKMQFVPSVYVMVLTLVVACLLLVLFLKTSSVYESALILAFVAYMFIYSLFLIRTLEQPFRKGVHSVDDVSLFLLRDFVKKLGSQPSPDIIALS